MQCSKQIPPGISSEVYLASLKSVLVGKRWYSVDSGDNHLEMRAGPLPKTTLVEPAPGTYRFGPPKDPVRFRVAKSLRVRVVDKAAEFELRRSFLARFSILSAAIVGVLYLAFVAFTMGVKTTNFAIGAVSGVTLVGYIAVFIHFPSQSLCRVLVDTTHKEAIENTAASAEI